MKQRHLIISIALLMAALILIFNADIYTRITADALESQGVVFNTPPDKLKCDISIWTWDVNAVKALTEKFNEKYPYVNVNIIDTAWADVLPKLKAAIMTENDVPDVVQIEIGFLGDARNLDGLENLSDAPYYGSEFNGKFVDYYEPLCRNRDGKFTSLPVSPGASATFYRRDIASKYLGTDDPDQLENIFTSWERVIEIGRLIKEKSDGNVFVIGDALEIFETILKQLNVTWVDENGKLRYEEDVRKAANIAIKARREGIDAGVVSWSTAWVELFEKGNTFMTPSGTWLEGYVIKENDPEGYGKWGVMSTPGGNVNVGGSSYAIPSSAKQKEAAWYWIKTATTDPAAQVYHFERSACIPALKTALDDPIFEKTSAYLGGQKAWKKYVQMMKDIKSPAINKHDFLASRIVNENISRAIKGKITVDQAINESEYQISEIINILERK